VKYSGWHLLHSMTFYIQYFVVWLRKSNKMLTVFLSLMFSFG